MQERGVAVDIFTLNSVLKACGTAGQVEREFLASFVVSVKGGGGGGGGCSGWIVSYARVIFVFLQQ